MSGGTANLNGSVAHAGALTISGGTLNFSSSEGTLTVPTLTLTNGTLTGSTTLTVTGLLSWSSGTMSGSGQTIAAGGLSLIGAGNKTLNRALSNNGAATWTDTGNIYMGNGGVFTNHAMGTFTVQNDEAIYSGGGSPRFDNAGTFVKEIGGGTTSINSGVPFSNSGTVRIRSGTLSFGGGYLQTAGDTWLDGGAMSATPNANIQAGTLEGSGVITGSVLNAGTVEPGRGHGPLTITGSYTQTQGGSFDAVLGGTGSGEFGKLVVTGNATLDGDDGPALPNCGRPVDHAHGRRVNKDHLPAGWCRHRHRQRRQHGRVLQFLSRTADVRVYPVST